MEMIHDLPKWAYIQALLSRGDRRVGKILMAAHRSQRKLGPSPSGDEYQPGFLCLSEERFG